MADKPQFPRVQSVQTLVRLIYEDATVGAVTTVPIELPNDPMEPGQRPTTESILQVIAEQGDVLMHTIKASGPDVLYAQAKAHPKTTCKVTRHQSSLPQSQQNPEDEKHGREQGGSDG